MPGHYLDSSAVAKFYHPELGSSVVEQIVLDPASRILISRLAVVEVQSVFAGKVRCGAISAVDAADLRHRFVEDVANGVFGIAALTNQDFDAASELVARHGARRGLRTLDSLQLAVALRLHHAGAVKGFVVADKVLGKVAALEGLDVLDPESAAD